MYMRKVLVAGALFILLINCSDGAILLPEEITSLTSLAYSLLPPIKLGQDSRFGFGFRLGRNADAQVLVELGPQTNTLELGKSTSKRQTNDSRKRSNRLRRAHKRRNIMKKGEKVNNTTIDKTQ